MSNLLSTLETHNINDKENKKYDLLADANCLIIDNFAEHNVYDKSIMIYNRFENELFSDGALNHMLIGQYFYIHWYNMIKKQ